MASSKEYLHFILEQLSDLDDVSYRPMMGEFILYYRGKIIGGIYDDRLLVKKTPAALELMPAAICNLPYQGAKEMLLVDEVSSKEFLTKLFDAMYDQLPFPRQKQKCIGFFTSGCALDLARATCCFLLRASGSQKRQMRICRERLRSRRDVYWDVRRHDGRLADRRWQRRTRHIAGNADWTCSRVEHSPKKRKRTAA